MPPRPLTRRLARALAAACVLAATMALPAQATSHSTARASTTQYQRARAIGAQAYVYGLALLDEQRVIDRFPANTLISITRLSTPAERLVPLPNVDTLYTTARLVLSGGPLVLHVPNEHGRYYVFQLLDAYTNSFAYIGKRVTGTRAGDFAIAGPRWHGRLPAHVRLIRSPTPTVWLLGRTLVHGPTDQARANAIQHEYTLTPLARYGGAPQTAVFIPASTLKPLPLPRGLAFYDALDAAMAQNPPPHSERALMRTFVTVGLGPGRTPSSEPLTAATRAGLLAGLKLGRREIAAYARSTKRASERAHRGWLLPPSATRNYARHYLLRAYIAQDALGANVPAEAVYPVAFVDSRLAPLSGRHRYVLRFAAGQLPPVRAFWSLTMYGRDLFLVPNRLHRYAIGDRTPHLRFGRDGSLVIYLQHSPPRTAAQRANWLPAPAGAFVLALRLYEPHAAVIRGTWPLPFITRTG